MSTQPNGGSATKRKRDSTEDSTTPITLSDDTAAKSAEREEKRKLKKQKKKNPERPAVFAFDAADLRSRSEPVSLQNIRELLVAVVEDASPQTSPKFVSAPPKSAIKHIAVLHIPGITPEALGMTAPPAFTAAASQKRVHPSSLFSGALPTAAEKRAASASTSGIAPAFPISIAAKRPETQLPAMSKLFSHGLPTRGSGEGTKIHDVINSILVGPIRNSRESKGNNQKQSQGRFNGESITLETLLLTEAELKREAFLLPSYHENAYPDESNAASSSTSTPDLSYVANGWSPTSGAPIRTPDWAEAPKATSPPSVDQPVVLAIDCEMVETANGKELARMAIVDFWTEDSICDMLVKPSGRILDYLTQYSGMTAAVLDPVTTTLKDAQAALIGHMRDSNAILLGHHISNDFRALKLAHSRIIDTSAAFDNLSRPGMKPSLKWLAQHWAGVAIQQGGGLGHLPDEDAKACVALVKKKVEHGLNFGKAEEARSTLFERMKKIGMSSAYVGGASVKYGGKADVAIECEKDDEVVENVIASLKTHTFVYGHMPQLAQTLGWTTHVDSLDPPIQPPQDAIDGAYKRVNASLKKLTASLSPSTALIVFTGCSDPRRTGQLNRKKGLWDTKVRSGIKNDDIPVEERWTNKDAEELEGEVEKTKAGLAFFCVTMGVVDEV